MSETTFVITVPLWLVFIFLLICCVSAGLQLYKLYLEVKLRWYIRKQISEVSEEVIEKSKT